MASQKMQKNKLLGLALLGAMTAGWCGHLYAAGLADKSLASQVSDIQPSAGSSIRPNFAGSYLSSHYAQSQNDWAHAAPILSQLLQQDPENAELLRQAMVLAEGSGNHALAAKYAKQLTTKNPSDGLAHLIVTTHAIATGQYDEALKALSTLPKGDMSDFVLPLLKGWAMAGKGNFNEEMFKGTTIHAYHGGLIAHYLKKNPSVIFGFAETILAPSGLTAEEVERAADLMAISGHKKDAQNVYKALVAQKGGSDEIAKKITALEKDQDLANLIPALSVKTPAQGASTAILDLARILYQENSDSSARVFAQMALDLDPGNDDIHILIASSYARNNQIDQAIAEYNKIPESNASYLITQHEAAELLAESGRMEDAVKLLNRLYASRHDPESLIRIGDLYRSKQDFKKALEIYNSVSEKLPTPIPAEYWYMLYARGMTEERLGNWDRAEADLKQALEYQPDHPYIMNYLGYAWIDRGEHMDEALKMLEKASSLRPADGYITDSVGWAHYKMRRFSDAVPILEQAVSILPYDPEINSHLGDAYWQVGRKVEARFQWERARNHSKDAKLTETLEAKLVDGLPPTETTKQATDNTNTTPAPKNQTSH